MGGFEIRSVMASEVQALASGRGDFGCEDDGPAEALTLDGRVLPVGSPPFVAEMAQDFAANTDGPWAPRWSAFQREMDKLSAVRWERIRAGERPPAQLSAREMFSMGAWAAMEWTLGVKAKPPFWQGPPALVSNVMIGRTLTSAGNVAAHGRAEMRPYAEGVRAWLRWITGQAPEVVYPPRS